MKKAITIFLLCVSMALSLGCLGQFRRPPPPETGAEITIFLGTEKFSLTTSDDFLFDALLQLQADEGIELEYTNTAFGRMLTIVGGENSTNSPNAFIAIYISVLDPMISNPQSRQINGTQVYSANFGADQLPVIHGAIYLLVVAYF